MPSFSPRQSSLARVVRLAARAAFLVAAGAAVGSLLDFDLLRAVLDRMASDGEAAIFDRLLHSWIVVGLRTAAIVAAAAGIVLVALRRPVVRFLAALPADAVDAARAIGRAARVGRVEGACAAVVFLAGAALAAQNLELPFRFDEANTALNYAGRDFFVILDKYNSPNNHVLHTLLATAAYDLGGLSAVALRMPAFLAACLVLPATWLFVRSEHGWPAAAFATVFAATSPLFIEYATNARGYSLMLLLFVLLLLCGRALVRMPANRVVWALYAVFIALGFLTIPVMAFPAAIVAAWMLLARWREGGAAAMPPFAARTAAWSSVALALTMLLYAPLLIGSGAESLFDNTYVRAMPRGEWLARFPGHLADLWSAWHAATPGWAEAGLLAMMAAGVAAPRRGQAGRGLFALAAALGTMVVFLVKPVLLQPRMSIFLLLASMIVAGAGAAFLAEAAVARLRTTRPHALSHCVGVLLVLAVCAWWATRPGVAERFGLETGLSPTAPALFGHVEPGLRPGDYVAASNPTRMWIEFHAARAGMRLTRTAFDFDLPGESWRYWRLGQDGPDAPGRLFLVVDDAARGEADSRVLRRHLDEREWDYEVAVDLDGGRVYRVTCRDRRRCSSP